MRISREYRVWPVYARDADMVYAIGRDSATNSSIDLSDTHSRLGRMAITRRAALSDEIVLAVVLAETPAQIADALTTALSVPADPQSGASAAPASAPPAEIPAGGDASAVDEPSADTESSDVGDSTAAQETAPDNDPPAAVQRDTRSRRAAGGAKAVFVPHGSPAAVLHTDGLWLADGTRVELTEPIVHVGQAAELAYSHNIGYQLTPKFCEPGQIRITDDPDPVTAWPGGLESFGRGFGQYKPEASALLAEHLDYLNGRDYRGKRHLTPAAEWRTGLPTGADAEGIR